MSATLKPTLPGDDAPAARPVVAAARAGVRSRRASVAVCLLAAVAIWLIFYPGLFSTDSLDQCKQALSGKYHDWHPPIMAIMLAGVFALGGHVAAVILIQCIAGLLGVRALALELLGLALEERVSRAARSWTATAIALFLLLPLSPLAFYLVTLWKDVWFAILLVWCGALAVRLYRRAAESSVPGDLGRLCALLFLAGLAPLVRHNALVTLPVLCVLCAVVAARRFGRLSSATAVVPLLVVAGAERWMERSFSIIRLHPENQIKALDLVGLCVLDPMNRNSLPFTDSYLAPDFDPARYRFGNVSPLFWDQPPLVKYGYVQGGPNDELGREYWGALRTHTRQVAEVKWRAFVELLGLRMTHYWIQARADQDDEVRLVPLEATAPIRESWVALAGGIAAHPRWRWIGGAPIVWIGVNLLLLAAISIGGRRDRALRALLLLLPLSYALSYLLAAPASDFRLMYPAILFVQIYAAAGVAGLVAVGVTCERAPADLADKLAAGRERRIPA